MRLERDLDGFKTAIARLKNAYELGNVDELYDACIHNLKSIGFDVSLLKGVVPLEYNIID